MNIMTLGAINHIVNNKKDRFEHIGKDYLMYWDIGKSGISITRKDGKHLLLHEGNEICTVDIWTRQKAGG